ncbi:MAG: DNA polymerase III subunit gamma/tau [Acholeplasmataceae bacterium]
MAYIALYRAYRPKTFDDVIGQEAVIQTLSNALKFNQTSHAYLFSGPRGTGKTSVAKIFAKAINCFQEENETYDHCDVLHTLKSSDMSDIIELDAASNNGVDEIRDIRDKVKFMPSLGKYKIYIIDEVHMLTTGAFNALLKTLEEPPQHVIFILATTEIHKIPQTILSRCQRFDFTLVAKDKIETKIKDICEKETINITSGAISAIASLGGGSVRDSISLLDQVRAYASDKITESIVYQVTGAVSNKDLENVLKAIINKETSKALDMIKTQLNQGKEVTRILADFTEALSQILKEKATNKKGAYQDIAEYIPYEKLYHFLDVINDLSYDIKYTTQKETYLELAVVKMIEHQVIRSVDVQSEIQSLRQEIEQLKQSKQVATQTKSENIESNSQQVQSTQHDGEALVTVSDVEHILHSSDKNKKELLLSAWHKLEQYDEPGKEFSAHLLFEGSLEAVTKTHMLLVYDDLNTALKMYEDDIKKDVLDILNAKSKVIEDYHVILKNDWLAIKAEYVTLWKQGHKTPKLTSRDLQLYRTEKQVKTDEAFDLAKEYFGDKAVKKGK